MAEQVRKNPEQAFRERPGAQPPDGFSLGANAMHSMPPPADANGKHWVRTSVLIKGEPCSLYGMWRNIEWTPLWQEQIVSVTPTGDKTSHWVMQTPTGTIEWDSEIMADEPGRRIAWQSIGGDSQHAGEVVFERAPGGTYVTVLQQFSMGKLASTWETVVGRHSKQAVIENLRHFKALAETGEIPRTHGQPHGPRGAVGSVKVAVENPVR